MYLWFFIVNTLICYKYMQDLKTICFGTTFCFWDWHISWFHNENDLFGPNWQPSRIYKSFWYVKIFLTSIVVFVILKIIYL